MSKYLRVQPGAEGEAGAGTNYHLPDGADLEQIAEQIAVALDAGSSLIIPIDRIYGQAAKSAYVVINGAQVAQAQIGEIPHPDTTSVPPPSPTSPRGL